MASASEDNASEAAIDEASASKNKAREAAIEKARASMMMEAKFKTHVS